VETTRLLLTVGYSQYVLQGLDCELGEAPYAGGNGLVWVNDGTAVVMTGLDNGDLPVTVTVTDSQPALDLDRWDDVVEVSMTVPGNVLALYAPTMPPDNSVALPAGPDETRSYRVRVHARGRDRGREVEYVVAADGDELVEEHAVIIWPAERAPETRWKLTDEVGAEIRCREPVTAGEEVPAPEASQPASASGGSRVAQIDGT
jgi:hypothetical protein